MSETLRELVEMATSFTLRRYEAFEPLPTGGKSNAEMEICIKKREGISFDRARTPVDRWAVTFNAAGCSEHPCVLSKSGKWDYEPTPSRRTDAWIKAHRFDTREEAFAAARKAIEKVAKRGSA